MEILPLEKEMDIEPTFRALRVKIQVNDVKN